LEVKGDIVSRQNLYITLLNSMIGFGMSLLFKGSLLVFLLSCIIALTILFIERQFVYEKVLRRQRWAAIAAAGVLVGVMISCYALVTKQNRETAAVVGSVQTYLSHLEAEEYTEAYDELSQVSKEAYSLERFSQDHRNANGKIQDFRIDEVEFNKYDPHKAVAHISSPFLIYGQSSLPLELIKEGPMWKLVVSPAIVKGTIAKTAAVAPPPASSPSSSTAKRPNRVSVSRILRSLF
jgi:hypothetical protein